MSSILIYVLRRDLRLGDNPIFHDIAKSLQQSHRPYTHVLPLYIVPSQQVETSGFLAPGIDHSPYPEARSGVAKFWRCGPNRAKFLAESVWDLKKALEDVGSGLVIQAGKVGDAVEALLREYSKSDGDNVYQIWMTGEEGSEEKQEECNVRRVAAKFQKEVKLWSDEKYFVHDDDVPLQDITKLPNVFTSYKKMVEPLREAPRRPLPKPDKLPPLPRTIPSQPSFVSPSSEEDFIRRLSKPVQNSGILHPPEWPAEAMSAHPFRGGERAAHERVQHYITSGNATTYKDTRNGMTNTDDSTKFSAWLALGCISARQIHDYLVQYEDGATTLGKGVHGYGKGENKGTGWIRFELLWRDYFRLCTRKFGTRLFKAGGFKGDESYTWRSADQDEPTKQQVRRFLQGTTGTGLIDASQKELLLTGWTSNRARQNVASFLAKHLGIDWRIGAEWYEYCLIDYDVSSNWGNWMYNAGVGNDPRESRMFNPVKQSFDYDSNGSYVKRWLPELRQVDQLDCIFQAWKLSTEEKSKCGLAGTEMAEKPLKKIDYRPGGKKNAGPRRGGKNARR